MDRVARIMRVSLYRLSSNVFNGKSTFLSGPFIYKHVVFTRSMFSACFTAKLSSQIHFDQSRLKQNDRSYETEYGNLGLPNQHHFLAINHSLFENQCLCYYSKKSKSKQNPVKRGADTDETDEEVDSDDSDSEEEEEIDGAKKDWKDLKMNVPSLRIDAVLSAGLGVSRKKIEEAFLSAKLRHNTKKVMKKSRQVQEGDVLDVVKEDRFTNKDGNQVMLVMRVEMRKIKEEKTSSDKTPIKLRRWKHLELPREK